jgi:tRNA nucleotidyltransferase/poly(A) polymerase
MLKRNKQSSQGDSALRLPDPKIFDQGLCGQILAALEEAGFEARAIGGAVRDALMFRPVHDVDIATTAPPDETARIVAAAGLRAIPTGIAHGTVTVTGNGSSIEVTTLRRDLSTNGRHAHVAFGTDWTEDAERRDFTINALSADRRGVIHDPVGGLPDIAQKRVRFIGDPSHRIAEDRLRAWRYFRFLARFGAAQHEPRAISAIAAARRDMGMVSQERVASELGRIVMEAEAPGALALAAETGLLIDVVDVPRLGLFSRLHGQSPEASRATRLGALSIRITEDGDRVADRLRLSNADRALFRAVALHAPYVTDTPRRVLAQAHTHYRAIVEFARALQPERNVGWDELLSLPQIDPVVPMPVRGADLVALGFAAGPEVGTALKALSVIYAESDYRLSRDALLEFIARIS